MIKKDWQDCSLVGRGLLVPHSPLFAFERPSDASGRDKLASYGIIPLNGKWKFRYFESEGYLPEDIADTEFDEQVSVPSCWQFYGHDRMQYHCCDYYIPVEPPMVPYENPTGVYSREFYAEPGKETHIFFEGVCAAFHVYINGKLAGYGTGSHLISEFDITGFVTGGKNTVTAVVYKLAATTYIEGQDMWRYGGIFRDVYAVQYEKQYLKDISIKTELDEKYRDAVLCAELEFVSEDGTVKCALKDADGNTVFEKTADATGKLSLREEVADPYKWTAETPYLYRFDIELTACGRTLYYSVPVGFRKIEIKNGVFTVNGKKVLIKGVNHHDTHPEKGYAVNYDDLLLDIMQMKRHNINAVRTSHYPAQTVFLDMCDKYGLYVISEADIETHGLATVEYWGLASNMPSWETQYVSRIARQYGAEKNHPCIIMWSLGNESGFGSNHIKMAEWIRAHDGTRPVHYEGDQNAICADVWSRMYSDVPSVIAYAEDPKNEKPFFLCEYAHAMGNGPGLTEDYMEVFRKYKNVMGGCVWEWADHGVKPDPADSEWKYGSDFGETINSGSFCVDGLCFPDRTPHNGLINLKYVYQPASVSAVSLKDGVFAVNNLRDYADLSDVITEYEIIRYGNTVEKGSLGAFPVMPGGSISTIVPKVKEMTDGECFITFRFIQKYDTPWAGAGYEVGHSQIKICGDLREKSAPAAETPTEYTESKTEISFSSGRIAGKFSKILGTLTSLTFDGRELFASKPYINVTWPMTDNDKARLQNWNRCLIYSMKTFIRDVQVVSCGGNELCVTAKGVLAAESKRPALEFTQEYLISGDGVRIRTRGKRMPYDYKGNMPYFVKFGLSFTLCANFERALWYGNGPYESYPDKRTLVTVGKYSADVDELFENHIRPQENGNRSGIRYFALENCNSGIGLYFGSNKLINFAARHYTDSSIMNAGHTGRLAELKIKETVVHADMLVSGVGTASCGPDTLPKYQLFDTEYDYELDLRPYAVSERSAEDIYL